MNEADDRAHLERLLAADELASVGRHDLRNRLATLRNATLFIHKALDRAGVLAQNARVAEFLTLMQDELGSSDQLIESVLVFEQLLPPSSPITFAELGRVLGEAFPSIPTRAEGEPAGEVPLGMVEAQLLASYLSKAASVGAVSLDLARDDREVRVVLALGAPVADDSFGTRALLHGPPRPRVTDGALLRRLIRRIGGELRAETDPAGGGARIEVALHGRTSSIDEPGEDE